MHQKIQKYVFCHLKDVQNVFCTAPIFPLTPNSDYNFQLLVAPSDTTPFTLASACCSNKQMDFIIIWVSTIPIDNEYNFY